MGKKFIVLSLLLTVVLVVVTSVAAITNGEPDGDMHPYVGVISNESKTGFCSGSAISADVFVTAAHCFNDGDLISVTFDTSPGDVEPADIYSGTFHHHPDFCADCGVGLSGTFQNDLAVISPLQNSYGDSPDLSKYGLLPVQGIVDTLPNKSEVTLVGYGFQGFITGGGPPMPFSDQLRHVAQTQLIANPNSSSEQNIKLSAAQGNDQGGFCFGDSGGPVLLGNSDLILSLSSFSTNAQCAGVTYSNRIDSASALTFINSFPR